MTRSVRRQAESPPVDEKSDSGSTEKVARWEGIKARALRHGITSVHQIANRADVSRGAVTAAEAGRASKGTYDRLEAWLDAFEEEIGADDPEPELVTFRITGATGVDITVSGPVANIDELRKSVEELLRGMGQAGTT